MNGHGGARPGAGRKARATEDYQGAMRGVFETRVTPSAWAAVIDRALEQAQLGDDRARAWLTPWLVGAEPKEVTVTGAGGFNVRVTYADEAIR